MTGLDAVRACALALPEVEEGTHFRLPSFKVRGKGFVGLEKGGTTAIANVPLEDARRAVSDDPATFEEVWRSGDIFVGVRIDLDRVPAERLRDLVELGWRNKAPKRLVASFDTP